MPRPRTRWFCRWKPRRSVPRKVLAPEAARFWCKAIENGATATEIERRIEVSCPDIYNKVRVRVQGGPQSGIAVEAAIQLANNNAILTKMLTTLGVVSTVLGGFALLGRLPQLRLLRLAASAAVRRIEGNIIEGQFTRVQNENLILEIQRLNVIRRALQDFVG